MRATCPAHFVLLDFISLIVHSLPFTVKVKNWWRFTSTFQFVFMALCFSSGAIPTFHKTIVCPKETIPCEEIKNGKFPVKGKLVPVPN
jgi:hypothetical protein